MVSIGILDKSKLKVWFVKYGQRLNVTPKTKGVAPEFLTTAAPC